MLPILIPTADDSHSPAVTNHGLALTCRWERDRDRVSAPVENGSRHLRFAGYDPPALGDEEDDHVPRP
jgi:hypothetical protein